MQDSALRRGDKELGPDNFLEQIICAIISASVSNCFFKNIKVQRSYKCFNRDIRFPFCATIYNCIAVKKEEAI